MCSHPARASKGRLESSSCSRVGGGTHSPSASRSWPAQAIMAPLSVHRAGGGTTSRRWLESARACSEDRTLLLHATPPDTTSDVMSGHVSRAQTMARLHFCCRCCTATAWNDAAMSARTWRLASVGVVTPATSTRRITWVLRPAYDISQVGTLLMGTDSGYAVGLPSLASASRCAPFASRPSMRATLSKASPAASSRVVPSC
mmetsp:Transcript_9375/g.28180  ORF Transcript_9375/g.28180 Transcript_9375/m.28180 type:complete len:202 (+) Transcript_9375:157-762(+)